MRIHNKGTLETRSVPLAVASDGTKLRRSFSGASDLRNPNLKLIRMTEKCGFSHPVAAISISNTGLDLARVDGLSTCHRTVGLRERSANERENVDRNRLASVQGRRAVAVVVSP